MKAYPNLERLRLKNGLVVLHSCNRNLPILSLGAFVRVGKDQNLVGKPGVAALTARLLDEGTQKHDFRQLSEMIENVGAEQDTFSDREVTGICLSLNSSDLSLGVDLISEMLRYPTFPSDRFELERSKVLNHIRSMNDDPEVVGSQLLNLCIYGDSALGQPVLGVPQTLLTLDSDSIRNFHRAKFGPQNTILVAVGDVEFDTLLSLVAERFADWENPNLKLTKPATPHRQENPVFRTKRMPKEQVTIFLGHLGIPRSNPDFYSLRVMDTILGGGSGFTSRIPRRLREEQGLAYSAYSDLTGSSGLYPGRFVAYLCTSPENRQKALAGLLAEIEDLVQNGVTEEELDSAKDFLTGSFVFEFQANACVARFLLATELFALGSDYPHLYEEAIQAVTTADVERVARQYLDTVNYTTVIVGSV